jgi:hypothetical protein
LKVKSLSIVDFGLRIWKLEIWNEQVH